ncbi:cysteine-rich receptor-like protein kinase 10 [Rosa sericea]
MQFLALYAPYFLLLSCILQNYQSIKAQVIDNFLNCNGTVNYTSGSVYEHRLNLTLNSLVASASLTGFYMTNVGDTNDTVYGLVQCRGDLSKNDCNTCANTAATKIRQLCISQKEASIGYVNCSLQYSNRRFFSTFDSFPRLNLHNYKTAPDPVLYNRQLGNLVKNLSSKAASDPSRFAIGFTSYTDFIDIYGMAQCTQDLAENSCLICLQEIAFYIPQDGTVGVTLLSRSCNLRYEIYSFSVSPSRNQTPPAALPPSPLLLEPTSATTPTTTGSNTTRTGDARNKISSGTIIVIVIPAVVALIVIIVVTTCSCYLLRKKSQSATHNDDVLEDGNNTMDDALLIGLSTLKVATSDFSDAYKLGEGGFGPVYKGKLPDGREIAVKRLSSNSGQGLQELKTEVVLVAKLLHRNLVRLLGFCLEDEEKLLVYEYLRNGSLDKILFGMTNKVPESRIGSSLLVLVNINNVLSITNLKPCRSGEKISFGMGKTVQNHCWNC